MISTSKFSGRVRAAWRTSSISSVTPRLVLAAISNAMWRAARSISGFSSAASPVVPTSSGLPAAQQAARFDAVAGDCEKSMAQSHSASAAATSAVTVTPRRPQPAISPTSRPRCTLPACVTAPVMRTLGRSFDTRTSAWPMRPVAPMMRTRKVPLINLFAFGEETLHAFEETLLSRCMMRAATQRFIQPPHQLALLRGELHGCLDHDLAEQIATRPAAYRLHALVAQPKDPPRL